MNTSIFQYFPMLLLIYYASNKNFAEETVQKHPSYLNTMLTKTNNMKEGDYSNWLLRGRKTIARGCKEKARQKTKTWGKGRTWGVGPFEPTWEMSQTLIMKQLETARCSMTYAMRYMSKGFPWAWWPANGVISYQVKALSLLQPPVLFHCISSQVFLNLSHFTPHLVLESPKGYWLYPISGQGEPGSDLSAIN